MKRKNKKRELKKRTKEQCFSASELMTGMGRKELAEKDILELKSILEKTPITPDSQTYIQLYEVMKSLYFCKKYNLVMMISRALKVELGKEN